jgi:hypothetical protein
MIVLNVDPRIAGPGRSVEPVTCSRLPRAPKIVIADFAQIGEPYAFGALPHSDEDLLDVPVHYDTIIDTIVKEIRRLPIRIKTGTGQLLSQRRDKKL